MKYNAWTLALIGAGVVSLPAIVSAEEHSTTNYLQTALSTTTISGYVDTSMQWNPGTGNQNLPAYTPNGKPGGTKADGFNFNVVALTLSKPAGEEAWSAGYNATLLFGPDAVGYNNSLMGTANAAAASDFSLKDTYVDLHAPLGNGLDIKLGTYTEVLGYEVFETGNNPNYTRSYGYEIEPTQMTGLLATYQVCSGLSVSGSICDAWSAGVNARSNPPKAESFKTYMGSVTFNCPTNFGFLSGSTLSGGAINGFDAVNGVDKTSLYIGGTLNTPIPNVKVGAAYDYVMLGPNNIGGAFNQSGYQGAFGLYLSWQATEKLSLFTRGEYFAESGYLAAGGIAGTAASAFEVTETLQYDLWKNVLARLEFRWDHAEHGNGFGGTTAGAAPTGNNAFMLAANFVYKF
jgi:hypothetical protein